MTKFKINTPENFSFRSTLYSHGWIDLLPFKLDLDSLTLMYAINLTNSNKILITISTESDKTIIVQTEQEIDKKQQELVAIKIKRIFRLNEDFNEFYEIAASNKDFNWIVEKGAGRLLNCETLWEDMVKMLCTTNCTWRLTQIMTENLFQFLGESKAFPVPEKIAKTDEKFLRDKIKMGYRAPYLLQFAQNVAEKRIDLNEYENWDSDSVTLYKELRKIKGFGDYAVSSLMKLLGRYDYMGFDSWNRKQFFNKNNGGKECSDEKIAKFYKKFNKWAGLFFWLDVTKDWYFKEHPWE